MSRGSHKKYRHHPYDVPKGPAETIMEEVTEPTESPKEPKGPCCKAREILESLGGSVFEFRESLPETDIFLHDQEDRTFQRYRLNPASEDVLERVLPDLKEP